MSARAAIVIQARMGSTRLPGKSLAPIGGRSLLARVAERLLHQRELPVVLAGTRPTLLEDDMLCEEAEWLGLTVVRGSADDVLGRYAFAASLVGAPAIIRATADNPAVDLDAPLRTLDILLRSGADYVVDYGLPLGGTVEAMTAAALVRAAALATDAYDREHVTPFVRRDARSRAVNTLRRRPRCGVRNCASRSTPQRTSTTCDASTTRPAPPSRRGRSTPSSPPPIVCARGPRPPTPAWRRGDHPSPDVRRRVPLQRAADGGTRGGRPVDRRRQPADARAAVGSTDRLGGTFAAVLFSFPLPLLVRTGRALAAAFGRQPESDVALLARMGEYAQRARARGALSLEGELQKHDNPFLIRALSLLVDGVPAAEVRHTLKTFSQVREEADAECALVLEAAGGYAPTLGILGAVLGLIHALDRITSPAAVGPGIAVAFVATVYGVGAANLVFLPLATRLRSSAGRRR